MLTSVAVAGEDTALEAMSPLSFRRQRSPRRVSDTNKQGHEKMGRSETASGRIRLHDAGVTVPYVSVAIAQFSHAFPLMYGKRANFVNQNSEILFRITCCRTTIQCKNRLIPWLVCSLAIMIGRHVFRLRYTGSEHFEPSRSFANLGSHRQAGLGCDPTCA